MICPLACRPTPPSCRRRSRTSPLFDGLGKHTRPVTTSNPEAQRYFDQGLNFLFAFNHDEAIRSFAHAATLDPKCAMAHWGVALANGPHINFPLVPPERAKAAWAALAKAREHAKGGTEVEQALIEALAKRYADPQPEDRRPLDEAYAAAMRDVYKRFPKDADVGALFAESLMDLRPWDLWSADGKPRPETPEVVETLEAVLKHSPDHPLALHLYIHAVEASPEPGKAAAAADRLRKLAPGLGHLVHMPSHIDLRLGQWQKAVEANERAIAADTRIPEEGPRAGLLPDLHGPQPPHAGLRRDDAGRKPSVPSMRCERCWRRSPRSGWRRTATRRSWTASSRRRSRCWCGSAGGKTS